MPKTTVKKHPRKTKKSGRTTVKRHKRRIKDRYKNITLQRGKRIEQGRTVYIQQDFTNWKPYHLTLDGIFDIPEKQRWSGFHEILDVDLDSVERCWHKNDYCKYKFDLETYTDGYDKFKESIKHRVKELQDEEWKKRYAGMKKQWKQEEERNKN